MPKQKSISQRLAYRLEPNIKQQIVDEWTSQKQVEYFTTLQNLQQCIKQGDHEQINLIINKLKDIGIKTFNALPNIAHELINTPPNGYKE